MTATVSAYRWVPPFAEGYVRDLRVRWALEEAGIPYQAALIDHTEKTEPEYRRWQPFCQVPAYRDDEVEMFESGAIVLHIAAKSEALAPRDAAGWARTMTWVVAALNSVEPRMVNFNELRSHANEAWAKERKEQVETQLTQRLAQLSDWLGAKDYLEGRFTVGDLIMSTVLRELVDSGMLARFPVLEAYHRRCEARPAFGRALEAQLEVFRQNRQGEAAAG